MNDDGSMMPFEIMPELFLGRSIRQLLSGAVREQFEAACREVIETEIANVFCPPQFGESDEVMITPVFDDDATRCQFLVVWARHVDDQVGPAAESGELQWQDLDLGSVDVRYRAIGPLEIEAAPWWSTGDGVQLWDHHHQVSSVGQAAGVMGELVTESVPVLVEEPDAQLRIDVPAAEMLAGLLQILHGTVRATGVDPSRVTVGVPVELAVDADLLPMIVHLRTLGARIDIVGLDALTAKLHTVSDTSSHQHALPSPGTVASADSWTRDPAIAIEDARRL